MGFTKGMNKQNREVSRREFLKASGAALGGAVTLPYLLPVTAWSSQFRPGANQRLSIAIIGLGDRGTEHLAAMANLAQKGLINIAAVCDVDDKVLGKAEVPSQRTIKYRDYRYILQRKDIDAVVLATPDFWHGVQFVQAAKSGKHIYCESPACSTIEEGKNMIEAARKAKIVSQIGAQSRSQGEAFLLRQYLASGAIGKITKVSCWSKLGLTDDNPIPNEEPPPELDWDLWLGPLHWQSYNARYSNGQFRWIMETGGGRICHPGAHLLSSVMWCMQADGTGPSSIEAQGTSPTKGSWDTPVEMKVTYKFNNPDWELSWNQPGESVAAEERKPDEPEIVQSGFGAIFHGEKGDAIAWGADAGFWTERKVRQWKPPVSPTETHKISSHLEDWFQAIRTGSKTIMDIEAGVCVANLCNLGNLSFTLGRALQWDQTKFEITGNEQARRLMSRPQRFPYYM